jgi:hypothetical protein
MATDLTEFNVDFDDHELTRLSAVLTACDLDLLTMYHAEVDARRLLYGSLSPEQRAIHQQLSEAGILNDPGPGG